MKQKSMRCPTWLNKAKEAMSVAVSKVLLDHKRKGLPIFVWQENRVVRIPSRRISPQ
jgi:hypothetical protein